MMNRLFTFTFILFLAVMFAGCSGGGNSPVLPSVSDGSTPSASDASQPSLTGASGNSLDCDCGHRLWGLWQGEFNPEDGTLDIVVLRDAQFHVNVTTHLQAPMPKGLTVVINDFDPATGFIDIDLTITHPFPGSNLRGFDVRGILMGAGGLITGTMDPTLKYPAPNGFRILNADGYTRWWNAQEFTSPGMYGFTPGDLGMKTYKPMATLNGFKYYSDVLSSSDPVVPNVSLTNRGTFSTDMTPPELTRNYQIQFPIGGNGKPIWLFQYAIDANWAPPTGPSPQPKPIDDFPIEANSPEAFYIGADTTGTTAYYVSNTDNGGDIELAIEIFDWSASTNPGGINGEITAIRLESAELFGGILDVPVTSEPGSQTISGIYTVSIPDVHPTGLEGQEILVTVWSADPTTYQPPLSGPGFPAGATLAAYHLISIPISSEPPVKSITVLTPNGGEIYDAGDATDITWSSLGPIGDYVKIEYSVSGAVAGEITASTGNDGSFTWDPIPDIASAEVKIIVTSVDFPAVTDESDNYFTVNPATVPQIIVTQPNGGEVWQTGSMQNITWLSMGDVGFEVSLGYTVNDGLPLIIEQFTDNDGFYQWVPIPFVESDQVKIVVTSTSNPSIFDHSDAYFSIFENPPPQITVEIPNGGELWDAGTAQEIQWSWVGDVGSEVRIEYTIDDGPPVAIIDQTNNDGSFMWDPIPAIDSDLVKIVITSFVFPLITDESDDYFSIDTGIVPTLQITYPNGGEVWESGTSETITWISTGDVGDLVSLDLEVSDSLMWPITASTENDGVFVLDPVPDTISNELRVIVTSIDHPTVTDKSDNYFTIELPIEPKITIEIPNGGEVWQAAGPEEITWTSDGLVGDFVSIDYIVSDATQTQITASTENDGTFIWNPVADIESTEVRIRVTSVDYPGVWDQSDNYFTITQGPVPEITVTIPNGGEVWETGTSQAITWTSANLTGQVKIEYTLYDGGTPIEISAATDDDGTFDWNPIPGPATAEARVRISSIDNPTVFDTSDNFFSIEDPKIITVTSPNGAEVLAAGGTWDITWDYTGSMTNVNILLSTDSGGSYPQNIVLATPCDGAFTWNPVAMVDTTTARIKVEWTDDTGINDSSDADFTIEDQGPLPGWNPVVGKTGIDLTNPVPNQGTQPADFTVYSLGANQSIGQIIDQTDNNNFKKYTDSYTATTGTPWQYSTITQPVHKFDAVPDGSVIFVCNANSEKFPNDMVNDPTYSAYSGNNNTTGNSVDGNWHLYGDIAPGVGQPDPDALPWRQQVDFSCGVTGGINDTSSYHLNVISMEPDNPQPHDGNIILGRWTAPYDATDALKFYTIDSSTQGGGSGPVDDTVPNLMALGVDDYTNLVFDTDPAIAHWILGSDGVISCHLLGYTSGSLAVMADYLDSGEFGTATAVDVEIAPALGFDYQVTDPGFNWVCVLLDNGDGTWSVGVWEPEYLADPFVYTLIDITNPLPGIPIALDVDGTDFEIHVLADNAGTIEATVFYYLPG